MVVNRLGPPVRDSQCIVCEAECDNVSVRCDTCKQYMHVLCSQLPEYYLVQYFKGRSNFYCKTCTANKFNDYDDVVAKFERSSTIQTSSTGHSPSAPSASQVLTQPNDRVVNPVNHNESIVSRDSLDLDHNEAPISCNQEAINTNAIASPQRRTDSDDTRRGNRQHGSTAQGRVGSGGERGEVPVCQHYRKRNCRYGRQGVGCRFRHPNLCRKFINYGRNEQLGCNKGKECKYLHPAMCYNSLNN